METNEVLIALAKAAAPPTILGLSLGEVGTVLAIIAALFNILTTGPAAYRMVRGWFKKEQ